MNAKNGRLRQVRYPCILVAEAVEHAPAKRATIGECSTLRLGMRVTRGTSQREMGQSGEKSHAW